MNESCPKCHGPAVRIEQSGELHCTNQCEENEPARERRMLLQHLTADIARLLRPALPKDVGFILILADYDVGGMAYASTMDRDGAVSLLQEMADKMRQDEAVSAHLVNTAISKAVAR